MNTESKKPVTLAETDERAATCITTASKPRYGLPDLQFRRKGSVNLYKNRRLKLAEMSFFKNWIDCPDGTPYPQVSEALRPAENTGDGFYYLSGEGHV
jgi:hypothetical protein